MGNTVSLEQLSKSGRWDSDFHFPPVAIRAFPRQIVSPVRNHADVLRTTRDPTIHPDNSFMYVDIASVDVESGTITNPQELTGEEAPSRARKCIEAYDIIISTCRPTRGAIAVIPEELHGQICSTGFSVIRAKPKVNPFYLHFALRLESTLEQFRKWSTGASYPAILDSDVLKTLIPCPDPDVQDEIARNVLLAIRRRKGMIEAANREWEQSRDGIVCQLTGTANNRNLPQSAESRDDSDLVYSIAQIQRRLTQLRGSDVEMPLFGARGERTD